MTGCGERGLGMPSSPLPILSVGWKTQGGWTTFAGELPPPFSDSNLLTGERGLEFIRGVTKAGDGNCLASWPEFMAIICVCPFTAMVVVAGAMRKLCCIGKRCRGMEPSRFWTGETPRYAAEP